MATILVLFYLFIVKLHICALHSYPNCHFYLTSAIIASWTVIQVRGERCVPFNLICMRQVSCPVGYCLCLYLLYSVLVVSCGVLL